MSDEKERGTESLIPSVGREIVLKSTSLVRRGLTLLEARKATEDVNVVQLRERADAGDADAQYELGVKCFVGKDVPFDPAQSLQRLRKAAEQGHADALSLLRKLYDDGQDAQLQEDAQSAQWFAYCYRKAAERGDAYAQLCLSQFYLEGCGVPKDWVEAYKWLNLAARTSRDDQSEIAEARERLTAGLTPDRLAEAEMRASEWLAAFEKRKP